MAMDLTGIQNWNEYYTNHYFASIFEENAADTLKLWREEAAASNERTPWAKLHQVAVRYYALRDQKSRARGNAQLHSLISQLSSQLLIALGYPAISPKRIEIADMAVPVALEITKPNGAPLMWVMLCDNGDDDESIMDSARFFTYLNSDERDINGSEETCERPPHMTNEEFLSKALFGMDEPPRWVLFMGFNQLALIDRNKWNEKRLLVFQLDDIFSRREETTLQAMAVLLHRNSVCPLGGRSLLDTLDDNSHHHASGVSKDLKYALRDCIEMLGNEVVRDMRERRHIAVYNKALADDLTLQCLRYMYRILFMLFIEAKPELGYAPMKAEVYALSYSFESLREVVDRARADEDAEADGDYLKQSLDMLFRLIYEGYPPPPTQKWQASVRCKVYSASSRLRRIYSTPCGRSSLKRRA